MGMMNKSLYEVLEKSQGMTVRVLDRLPVFAQQRLAKALNYPYQYPKLDPLIKCVMAFQLKQGKVGFIHEDYQKSREQFEVNVRALKNKPTAIEHVEDLRLPLFSGTLFARHYHPKTNKKLPMLVFFHGGGFVVGSLDTHDEACRLIAKYVQVQILSIDYPLAPEASPQQIIQSCEDALAWVFQNRRNFKILKDRIAVGGDSAGGNLAAVVAQRCHKKVYAPHAQFLIYPVLDFKSRHPSFFAYKNGLVLTEQDVDVVEDLYLGRHHVDQADPLVSPTYGHLDGLAPTYIITAGHDILKDEGEIYSHKLKQAGVTVSFHEYTDQTHGFINLTSISYRSKKCLIEMSKQFRKFWDEQL